MQLQLRVRRIRRFPIFLLGGPNRKHVVRGVGQLGATGYVHLPGVLLLVLALARVGHQMKVDTELTAEAGQLAHRFFLG
ncbi:hypothetical protein D3C87_2063020 [compost metagenome]